MKKIGIITIEGNKNYGNKLQNYALQNILENYGFEVSTLFQKKKIYKIVGKKIKAKISGIIKPKSSRAKENKREKKFINFTKKYLNIKYISRKKIIKLDDEFDYYIIGSDQIWNPCVIKKYLGLEIFKCKKRKISYAASIAQKSVSENYKEMIKKEFTKEKIPFISLREETGKKIIEEITKRKDIKCVLDPTLLLKSSEWDKLIEKPKFISNEKYILCYFLGGIPEERKKIIEEYANINKCEIIDILNPNSKAYYSSPNEFLYLEKNAFTIFTDSFHSSVFGYIFNTTFYIFERKGNSEDMSSRLYDFVDMLNLKERIVSTEEVKYLKPEHNYAKSYETLEKEREKSEEFLRIALDIEVIK